MALIEVGKGVMLKKGKNLRYICASQNMEQLERFEFDSSCMIGKRYGTAFQITSDKKLEVINPILVEEHAEEYTNVVSASEEEEVKDNRHIEDISDSQNQKLSKEDIISLQEEGMSGEQIIKELVENSSTFSERTEFSKAKYLKKKKKKYMAQFVALKPTARLLSQMYFFKNPLKILDVRPDTLAQILTWSNVQSGSRVLLFENCQGLIAGSVLERLGSSGRLIQLYKSSFPVRIIMEQYNFSIKEVDGILCSLPLDKLELLEELFQSGKSDEELLEMILGKGKSDLNGMPENKNQEISEPNNVDATLTNSADNETHSCENKGRRRKRKFGEDKNEERKRKSNRVAYINREQRLKESQIALPYLRDKQIDSLIIISKYHPKNVLLALMKFLSPASPFVVYFTHQEPLMECYVVLRELNLAANIELTDSWLRHIQVLPNRTHPEIVMSASGGYILRGIKVAQS